MSAVRMVAYGVLEMKHKLSAAQTWLSELSPEEQKKLQAENFERDKIRKVVNDELRRYGLLISRMVTPTHSGGWRTKNNAHVLYGQIMGTGAFAAREILCEGDFKQCCVKAAEVLDALDASQKPDAAAGPDQR